MEWLHNFNKSIARLLLVKVVSWGLGFFQLDIDLKGCSFGIQFSSLLTQIHLATLIYLYLIPLLLEVFGIGMNVNEPPLFDKIL